MVKFAEAEKRGREGNDRRIAPVLMLERPKINRAMWEKVKFHILRDRRRKKEELEADAKEKRMRKEHENYKKQHAMTLEETREQLSKEETKLNDLRTQKHDLVQQLKKVLNDESRRKNQEQQQLQQQQQNYMKESEMVPVHPYSHSLTLGSHPQMIFPANIVPGRSTNLYKGNMKRSRTPSPPPPQPTYQQQIPFVFKNNSVVPVSLSTSKGSSGGTNVYMTSQPYYHNQGNNPAVTQAAIVAPYLTTPTAPQPSRDEKHLQPLYLSPRVATSHVSAIHQPIDHKGKPPGMGATFSSPSETEKFYSRPHLVLLPGQQPQQANSKGSITSGFSVRASQATTQPPHTVPSTVAHSYSGHNINISRNYNNY